MEWYGFPIPTASREQLDEAARRHGTQTVSTAYGDQIEYCKAAHDPETGVSYIIDVGVIAITPDKEGEA